MIDVLNNMRKINSTNNWMRIREEKDFFPFYSSQFRLFKQSFKGKNNKQQVSTNYAPVHKANRKDRR